MLQNREQHTNKTPPPSLPSPQSKETQLYSTNQRSQTEGRGGGLQSNFLAIQKIYYLLEVTTELLGAQGQLLFRKAPAGTLTPTASPPVC